MKKNLNFSEPDADVSIGFKVKNSFIRWAIVGALITAGATFLANRATPPAPNFEPIEYSKPVGVSKQGIAEATESKSAITDRNYRLASGWCSEFSRKVAEANHGPTRYRFLFGASAKDSANAFLRNGYAVVWPRDKGNLGGEILPGDYLFKRTGSGGYGHVGVYAGNGLVAENSSTRHGRIQGAKGYRTLKQYGSFDAVGRLPNPKRLYLDAPGRNAKLIPSGELWEAPTPRGSAKTITVDPREVAKYLGKTATDNHAPLRAVVSGLGYRVTRVEYSTDRVTVSISD